MTGSSSSSILRRRVARLGRRSSRVRRLPREGRNHSSLRVRNCPQNLSCVEKVPMFVNEVGGQPFCRHAFVPPALLGGGVRESRGSVRKAVHYSPPSREANLRWQN